MKTRNLKTVSCLPGAVALLAGLHLSAATLHVSLDSPNPSPPFATWATAATNIQQAVDAASAGDEVVVTNGVYATGGRAAGTNALLNRVAVDKPLTLRSVNGPQLTIIQGHQVTGTINDAGAIRGVYMADGARLSGFTVTNGATLATWNAWEGRPEHSGGGVYCDSTNAVLTNCLIIGNSASGSGGGARGGSLYSCTLTNNSSEWFGGGASGATLYSCLLTGNSASVAGGGANGGALHDCTLTANSAEQGGGAAVSILYDCLITANSASLYGGGAVGGNLFNCRLTGNSADMNGGGVRNGVLYNCVLAANRAENGSAACGTYDWGGDACVLYNCTLVNNEAAASGCAVARLVGPRGDCRLYNCIIYGNRGANHSDSASIEYSCTTPLPGGLGNIDADPRFLDAAGGDFRLRPDSPCIDAGTNLTEFISTDILGLPRPLDGNGDGLARFDMGAYEFNPYRFEPTLHVTPNGLEFTVRGEPGKTVQVERSRDLVNWELVATVPIPASGQTLVDPAAATEPFLFYRAVAGP